MRMKCTERHTKRSEEEKKKILHRLARMEGQLRGISKMVEEECYCADIVNQLTAVEKAIHSLSGDMLERHLRTCVVKEVQEDGDHAMEEAYELIRRWAK